MFVNIKYKHGCFIPLFSEVLISFSLLNHVIMACNTGV